ncbi:Ethylene-responsive transcription factor ERF012 [Rhynchospora pubera]|uniref:Ethylene-responsive transcription factor ERF012 n=1 Tax=Rhynchospora pubera TaxID=906938 RepID=A0AAV8HLW5_9POAL|nr:Ethylene-responsive transcription factor ERF012 [Rhynchospora pubera]KAJ4817629.1 Ethylene-responsive transcription factor ERF012 [Rhynchospora pubera]
MVKSAQDTVGLLTSHTTPRIGSHHGKKSSQYKGVRMRSWGSWVSEIRAPNQKTRIWLGSYSTPEAAARAYDAALLCLKGSSANLNFPSAIPFHLLPQNTVMSPKSIQRVAAAAANATTCNQTASKPSLSPLSSNTSGSSDSCNSDGCYNDVELEEPTMEQDFNGSLVDVEAFFQSPKCMDYMLNTCGFFAPDPMEDFDEEGEIRLWSFC